MKIQYQIKTALLVSVMFFYSSLSFAKTEDFKLAVADFQQALNSVEEGKTAKTKLKEEFKVKQKNIDKRKKELASLQKQVEEFHTKAASGLLKPAAMDKGHKLEQKFQKKLQKYTAMVKSFQDEISKKEMKATQGILDRLRNLVVDLGRKEGYSMVLEKNESGLLYAASYTDLTEKLIQEYNKKYKSKKK